MKLELPGSPVRLRTSKVGVSAVIALGCLLAIAVGASASNPRTGGELARPPALLAKRGGAVVTASLGTYNWNGPQDVTGVNVSYPLPLHKRLTVSPGDRVSLQIGTSAARVAVSLLDADEVPLTGPHAGDVLAKLKSNPVSQNRSRWVTKLPQNLQGGNVLDISVQYANDRGEADFWVGL